jgi:hypothetical protein
VRRKIKFFIIRCEKKKINTPSKQLNVRPKDLYNMIRHTKIDSNGKELVKYDSETYKRFHHTMKRAIIKEDIKEDIKKSVKFTVYSINLDPLPWTNYIPFSN